MKKENKKTESRFSYSSDKGLKVVSHGDVVDNKEKSEKNDINKSYKKWL